MKKILIIDDSKTFRSGLKKIIETINPSAKIYECDNGKEAFHLLTGQSFDHIFTDLEMENGGGRGFLEKMMGNKILAKKKITILSSSIAPELKERFKDNKNITFVSKSTLTIMADKISALLK
jgi:DNA-binding NarL/FixJ family response regulator